MVREGRGCLHSWTQGRATAVGGNTMQGLHVGPPVTTVVAASHTQSSAGVKAEEGGVRLG